MVPTEWAKGVEGYPVPTGVELSEWMAAFVGQAGQLEKANGRTIDALSIVGKCEELVNASR